MMLICPESHQRLDSECGSSVAGAAPSAADPSLCEAAGGDGSGGAGVCARAGLARSQSTRKTNGSRRSGGIVPSAITQAPDLVNLVASHGYRKDGRASGVPSSRTIILANYCFEEAGERPWWRNSSHIFRTAARRDSAAEA